MPKAEVGSTKYLANKMKAKGLQRLRWYCQICGKQCRDENGFKQHTMSEGHVRAMLLVGEDPRKYIEEYSQQFKRDFLQLLRTSHGEKKVSLNGFYQEYIRDKEHIHMNATKWPSLTEFAKYLGREGICKIEEGERGLEVQWIDDSPEAVKRREDIKRKERLAKGDEDIEARLLELQIKRAKEAAEKAGKTEDQRLASSSEEIPAAPVKVSLSLGRKSAAKQEAPLAKEQQADASVAIDSFSNQDVGQTLGAKPEDNVADDGAEDVAEVTASSEPPQPSAPKMSLSLAAKQKHSSPLMRKNPLAKGKSSQAVVPEKKMSNAERIMREELERKRLAEQRGGGGGKRQRMA